MKKIILISIILIIFLLLFLLIIFRLTQNEDNFFSAINSRQDEPNKDLVNAVMPKFVLIDNVPFTAQAPFGDWDDVKQDYGCEEASLLMAMAWVNDEILTPEKARDEIIAISEFELENYQHHHDYSIADTLKVLKSYFNYGNAFIRYGIKIDDIKSELASGSLVIIPINGMAVTNPYYFLPGPFHHQILVIGYDDDNQELIVNDPGTIRGAVFRYKYQEVENAIRDYDTGLNEPVDEIRTAMLVIKPKMD